MSQCDIEAVKSRSRWGDGVEGGWEPLSRKFIGGLRVEGGRKVPPWREKSGLSAPQGNKVEGAEYGAYAAV